MGVLFGILMSFFVDLFGRVFLHAAFKIAITLAFMALFVSAIYAYVSSYNVIVSGIVQTVPDIVTGVWGWVMPSNVNLCLFALFSCVMLRFITRLYLSIYNFKIKAAVSS
jgi:hypothetical protein